MAWIKIIFFVATNLPTIIKFMREIMDLFDGDTKSAKATLLDMRNKGALKEVKDTDDWKKVKTIFDRHRRIRK